ncbi:hypothetical protein JCM24511_09995 [Saitozyma sp. JCM 24511]|nr:hypothetical protein JCM24511_09995 [Saitozyma sp. JCM 24511]
MTINTPPVSDDGLPHAWIETPLVESASLSKLAGCRVFLKLENLQPSGSFKSRGIGNFVRSSILSRSPGTPITFYISSGGNAGLACVAAAVKFGHRAIIVVPLSTKPLMISKLLTAGAVDVIQHGASWKEADTYLREEMLPKDVNGVYVPPFDHPDVWTGAATMVDEIELQLGKGSHMGSARRPPEEGASRVAPDAIVCSVGGGGLFCGIMQGLKQSQVPQDTKVVAAETIGAESFHAAVQAKQLVTLPAITSIATSLGARQVCQQALDYGLSDSVRTVLVTDDEAVQACWRFADEERLIVEPACGATLAVVYEDKLAQLLPRLDEESKVVLIVCGGSNITIEMLAEHKRGAERT